jgi:hypothetical protein
MSSRSFLIWEWVRVYSQSVATFLYYFFWQRCMYRRRRTCCYFLLQVEDVDRGLSVWRTRSTTDHTLCICQILEKKWEYNEAVHQLFIDFKKACDSVRTKVLCNILIDFGIPMKVVRLLKMCVNEIYSRVRSRKYCLTHFILRMV